MDKSKEPCFYGPRCIYSVICHVFMHRPVEVGSICYAQQVLISAFMWGYSHNLLVILATCLCVRFCCLCLIVKT